MRSKWRRRINYALYVIIVSIVILIGFNIYFTFRIHHQIVKLVSEPGRWPAGAYQYNPLIGFDFAPNVSDYIGDGSFYVKSHNLGYRIGQKENVTQFQSGGILALGCSFTYGDEVECEQTFTQLIADSLGIDAYNYGVSSFSYIHALLKAKNLKEQSVLDKLQPRFVILGCWEGLLERSRNPIPPLARSIPLEAAHIVKGKNGPEICPPANFKQAYEIINIYRNEGKKMSFRKFVKIFFVAPQYINLFLTNGKKSKKSDKDAGHDVTDYEIYDLYFSAIEKTFSSYGSQIIVLYMPNLSFDMPDQALIDVLANHPEIILVEGQIAVDRFNVSSSEYQRKHPQPEAHRAYAWETIKLINR